MWFVYALYNRTKNKIYIGYTGNLKERIAEHNKKRGNHYTKLDGDWELIYKEQVNDKHQGLIIEKQLKSHKGRDFIKSKIREY